MAIQKIDIELFLELAKTQMVIDVRSPGEYNHAHIPGAYSLPLFTDEERKIVGTTYKQESREAAIKVGLDFFGPRMKQLVEEVDTLVAKRTPAGSDSQTLRNSILLYCWRGGMRSAGVGWLMDLYGFKVYTLAGGYKKFRNFILNTFRLPFQFKLLGGYTGSGKTELLNSLQEKGELVVDLEKIAGHKGSAFGNIGLPKQPTQEMFENKLGCELLSAAAKLSGAAINGSPEPGGIWLEDESQRIGDVNIPHELWRTMRQSPVYFLDIPFEERLKHISQEYGGLDKGNLISSIERIQDRLGGLQAKNAIDYLNQDNIIESFRILLKYYDKWYFKSLHNRDNINSLLTTIPYEKVETNNRELLLRQSGRQQKTSGA
jgi:tRNA 2-selenouridine synthase